MRKEIIILIVVFSFVLGGCTIDKTGKAYAGFADDIPPGYDDPAMSDPYMLPDIEQNDDGLYCSNSCFNNFDCGYESEPCSDICLFTDSIDGKLKGYGCAPSVGGYVTDGYSSYRPGESGFPGLTDYMREKEREKEACDMRNREKHAEWVADGSGAECYAAADLECCSETPPPDVCGDNRCGDSESSYTCPDDCTSCGNEKCDAGEDVSCPGDMDGAECIDDPCLVTGSDDTGDCEPEVTVLCTCDGVGCTGQEIVGCDDTDSVDFSELSEYWERAPAGDKGCQGQYDEMISLGLEELAGEKPLCWRYSCDEYCSMVDELDRNAEVIDINLQAYSRLLFDEGVYDDRILRICYERMHDNWWSYPFVSCKRVLARLMRRMSDRGKELAQDLLDRMTIMMDDASSLREQLVDESNAFRFIDDSCECLNVPGVATPGPVELDGVGVEGAPGPPGSTGSTGKPTREAAMEVLGVSSRQLQEYLNGEYITDKYAAHPLILDIMSNGGVVSGLERTREARAIFRAKLDAIDTNNDHIITSSEVADHLAKK